MRREVERVVARRIGFLYTRSTTTKIELSASYFMATAIILLQILIVFAIKWSVRRVLFVSGDGGGCSPKKMGLLSMSRPFITITGNFQIPNYNPRTRIFDRIFNQCMFFFLYHRSDSMLMTYRSTYNQNVIPLFQWPWPYVCIFSNLYARY